MNACPFGGQDGSTVILQPTKSGRCCCVGFLQCRCVSLAANVTRTVYMLSVERSNILPHLRWVMETLRPLMISQYSPFQDASIHSLMHAHTYTNGVRKRFWCISHSLVSPCLFGGQRSAEIGSLLQRTLPIGFLHHRCVSLARGRNGGRAVCVSSVVCSEALPLLFLH